jgi:hypothetical protein
MSAELFGEISKIVPANCQGDRDVVVPVIVKFERFRGSHSYFDEASATCRAGHVYHRGINIRSMTNHGPVAGDANALERSQLALPAFMAIPARHFLSLMESHSARRSRGAG